MATTLPEHPGLSALIDKVSAKRNGDDLWYVELIIGLAALGRGDLTPLVYSAAVALATHKSRPWLRIREALLKATLPCGQWKIFAAESALFPIVAQTPGGVPSEQGLRGEWRLDGPAVEKAETWLKTVYGEEMAAREIKVTGLLAQDIGDYIRVTMAYVFAEDRIINLVETERIILLSLVCQNVATVSVIHARALVKLGGTAEDAHAVVDTAVELAEALGMKIQGFPNLDAVLQSS